MPPPAHDQPVRAHEFSTDHLGGGLHTYHYPAVGAAERPSKVLYLQHGAGEHAGRYTHVASTFAHAGYHVVAWDHQGHGRSSRKRGTIVSWAGFTSELNSIRAEIEMRLPGPHLNYYWGHSLGGLSLLHYLLNNPAAEGAQAAVVTSPLLILTKPPSDALAGAASALAALAPNLTKSNELDARDLSHNPGVVSHYTVDPLNHDRVSMRLGAAMLRHSRDILSKPVDLPCPLLLMHGDEDGICHVDGSRQLAARATPDQPVTLRIWPGAYHELHNEPEWAEVLAVAEDFLAQYPPASARPANILPS